MGHKVVAWAYGQGNPVVKRGKTDTGKPRDRCHPPPWCPQSFLPDPAANGRLPESKQKGRALRLKGSGLRAPARVVPIRTARGIQEVKKKGRPSPRGIPLSGVGF